MRTTEDSRKLSVVFVFREEEMAKNSGAFSANERINHSIYGLGTISEVNDLHTVIEFDQNGRKKFVTSIVQLERTSVPAPVLPVRRSRAKTTKSKTKDN
jgi:hypothetical protein